MRTQGVKRAQGARQGGPTPGEGIRMLVARNDTRNTDLVTHGRVASRPCSRIRGLIGTAPLRAGDGLWITPCNGIHMWFMSYALDIVYLDKDMRVIAIDENMRPWRTGRIVRGGRSVLELPAGTVQATSTCVGDALSLKKL